jgi:hypothetical protein
MNEAQRISIEQFHQRMENQRRIIVETCTKALARQISLTEAIHAIEYSDPECQDSIYSVYPEIEILSSLPQEVEWFPDQREQIEDIYRERANLVLQWLLEEFTGLKNQHTVEIKIDPNEKPVSGYLWLQHLEQQKQT